VLVGQKTVNILSKKCLQYNRLVVWRRRFTFFFRERYWWIVAFLGVVLVFVGFCLSDEYALLSAASVGIGTSMLAAMLVSFAGPNGEETYRKFLQMGVTDFYPNRSMVPNENWVNWLEGAQRSCILLGQAHGEWIRDDRFEPAFVGRLIAGIRIEIFFLNPNTSEADVREKEDRQKQRTKARIKDSIRELWKIRSRLNETAKSRLKIYTYDATPSLGVTWIDDWMLVTHYLAGFSNLTAPALRVESSPNPRSPYAVYARNVDQIRDHFSMEVSDDNISKYTDEYQYQYYPMRVLR
jgi:hypothetical protein